MIQELSHAVLLRLHPDVEEKLVAVQKLAHSKLKDTRFCDHPPHISLGEKFMGEDESDQFVEEVSEILSKEKEWEIEFSHFGIPENSNYIFLYMNDEVSEFMTILNKKILSVTAGASGREGLPQKYPYTPHCSIVKFEDGEDPTETLKLLEGSVEGIRMMVEGYVFTREKIAETGYSEYPTIGEISLK